jgi:hypothetical protein
MVSPRALAEHLVLLPGEAGGRWALWRTVCVRGAGFPVAEALRLADPAAAAAADRLAAVEDEAESLRQAALEALRGELAAAAKERLDGLVKAIRRVKRGQPAAAAGLAEAAAAAVAAWNAAAARAGEVQRGYEAELAAADERLDRELRAVAGGERFREALVWQNRHAAETGLAAFLRRPRPPDAGGQGTARDRGHAQMLASYLQRYAIKNDTIGFFGPVGWARLGDGAEAVAARPGEELIAARRVYFEGWAIDAIAERLAAEPGMRPWLAPRRSPLLRREGSGYVAPGGQRLELGPLSSALLAACDGTRPARRLLAELGELSVDDEATLWEMLADLDAKRLLHWGFQIPLSLTPERTLREQLLAIEEEPLRERALAALDEVVGGRDAVERAAGDAGRLARAMGELEAAFVRATGRSATRADGLAMAGRTLVFEDCRRDLDLELGAPFLAALAPALSLVLASARWFTYFVAADHREVFAEVHEEMSAKAGSPAVDLLAFSRWALPRLVQPEIFRQLERELHSRWEAVLALPPGARRVSRASAELRPRALREFAAPGPGWQKARYHSPDLLVAAASLEAIRRGDYEVVLGEIHLAINTLDRQLFFSQHPDPERLGAAIEADLPEPSVIPVLPKMWKYAEAVASLGLQVPAISGRLDVALRSPKDYYLDFSLDPPTSSAHLLAIGELVVEPGAEGLVVGPRGGGVRFDVVEFFQLVLMAATLETFRVLPAGAHTPRVTVDRLVIARESWNLPAGGLDFAGEPTAAARFAAARRWAARRELPRFLFVKTPLERKPFYLDLASPVLVEIFAKAVRRAAKAAPDAAIVLSEMLPEHGRHWLPDAQGNRYTCELRMVALDLG